MLEIMERSYTHAGLQALAEVQLRRGKDKQSSTQALHVQAPYHLRAEVYNFMGQMMVMLTANGARLQAYVPSRKTLYSGMATRQRMEQFAYVPLMPADMVALLLQRLPSGVMQLARVEKGTGNRLRFIISDHQEYVVGFDADQVRRIAYTELDGEVFSITYAPEAPINMEGDSFPRKMVLEIPAQELTLDIELEDVQLNPDIEPDLFEIKERAGVKSLLLEDF
jgi:outer membrane lipoprotein-sorting protein